MVCIPGKPAFLSMTIAALFEIASPAFAVEASSAAPPALSVCLVGLGSGDGSPAWSQLDVTPNRSVDLDLADGTGLTVACGMLAPPKSGAVSKIAPGRPADPSIKGDFGSL
ncbi:hypothetical protein ANOBCDAF_02482 [Pleomorphomonas sp. T1.2MG-36]|uniref:hypothetical protein n=1 Tax=Pleomorphomonas sp. T1.2MG-36 TaxID=3041167 RepID=UPI0024775302|nr:hypothetical protein [Pleomorphomonas sp. T1.2MG-36]CAI9411553.1 hypothetical protein ANOBCDAF_02482 [Pleomorphomonas sp. T1.2MG-36]